MVRGIRSCPSHGERRAAPRQQCEGKVELRLPAGSAKPYGRLALYLRDRGPGGISGTCFDCPPPRVNEVYTTASAGGRPVTVRVAWTKTAVNGVHMVGLQYIDGPVAV